MPLITQTPTAGEDIENRALPYKGTPPSTHNVGSTYSSPTTSRGPGTHKTRPRTAYWQRLNGSAAQTGKHILCTERHPIHCARSTRPPKEPGQMQTRKIGHRRRPDGRTARPKRLPRHSARIHGNAVPQHLASHNTQAGLRDWLKDTQTRQRPG